MYTENVAISEHIIRALVLENQRLRDAFEYMQQSYVEVDESTLNQESSTLAAPETKSTGEIIPEGMSNPIAITHLSTPQEKLDLFRSLFRGREDVHAKRWLSADGKRSGYTPSCANFWKTGCNRKRKRPCFDCEISDYRPLTDETLMNHLRLGAREKDTIGIYPLLEDDTTWLLAIDFDGIHWKNEALAYSNIAHQQGFSPAFECSRSGEGAHVWFFFTTPIPAKTARRFGSALLTLAMESNTSVRFTSYDRLFPSQDTLPKGGFGNLIALPLQGSVRELGRSVFLDAEGISYPDQWAYLSTIQKISPGAIDSFLTRIGHRETLGALSPLSDTKASPDSKPWEKQNKRIPLDPTDFSEPLSIVKANMLHIPKQALSPRALNRMRRLAAFSNPKFYENQRLRLYIGPQTVRIINAGVESEEYLSIPRGCEEKLVSLLDDAHVNYRIEDKTDQGTPLNVIFTAKLRSDQRAAFKALAAHSTGVLAAATAFGKTYLGARLIAEKHTNALVLVHTTKLASQWVATLEKTLLFSEGAVVPLETTKTGRQRKPLKIGFLSDNKNRLTGRVDVAMVSSVLDKFGNFKENVPLQDYGLVIVDECHHVAAPTFEAVMRQVHAHNVYGLSATPQRKDGLHPIVFMHCGPIRYTVSEKKQNKKRGFVHEVVPRFTMLETPQIENEHPTISQIYAALADNEERNALIVNDALTAIEQNRVPLILAQTTKQVELIASALDYYCENVIKLTGSRSIHKKREDDARLMSIADDEPLAIVATGKYVGEGFDFPRLDTLFLASPISWKGVVQQYVGRLNREHSNKQILRIFDYVDIGIQMMENMYFKRLKHYRSQDYRILDATQPDSEREFMFDGKEYWVALHEDTCSARKEIQIVCPRLTQSGVVRTIGMLADRRVTSGIDISIVTSAPERYSDDKRQTIERLHNQLESLPQVTLDLRELPNRNYLIIDRSIVWFGNLSPLGYSSANSTIMRIISREIAERLLIDCSIR